MAKSSKNIAKARAAVIKPAYPLPEAVGLLKQVKYAKFDETVDLTMRLGVDTRHADQMVRGTVVLPHGLGKTKTVAVIATGDRQKEATEAGADFVGGEEMVEKIQKENWTAFDALIATPDMMKVVGRLGKVLGPKGLMPNPKTGTVTMDVAAAVKETKAGKVEFRADKTSLGGNHVWRQREVYPFFDSSARIVRPATPAVEPRTGPYRARRRRRERGRGHQPHGPGLHGYRHLAVSHSRCPGRRGPDTGRDHRGRSARRSDQREDRHGPVCLDGRVTAVIGTHTHVQTADERVSAKGTRRSPTSACAGRAIR